MPLDINGFLFGRALSAQVARAEIKLHRGFLGILEGGELCEAALKISSSSLTEIGLLLLGLLNWLAEVRIYQCLLSERPLQGFCRVSALSD